MPAGCEHRATERASAVCVFWVRVLVCDERQRKCDVAYDTWRVRGEWERSTRAAHAPQGTRAPGCAALASTPSLPAADRARARERAVIRKRVSLARVRESGGQCSCGLWRGRQCGQDADSKRRQTLFAPASDRASQQLAVIFATTRVRAAQVRICAVAELSPPARARGSPLA